MDNCFILQDITFLWNVQKAQTNLLKHGLTFEQACEVFFDPFIRVVDASAEEEARDAVIGVNSSFCGSYPTRRRLFPNYISSEGD